MANTAVKVIGLVVLTTGLLAFKKKRDYTEVIEKMTIDLDQIKNLRSKNLKLFMDVSLAFHNNTDIDFDVYTAGLLKLRRMTLKYKGQVIGNAYSSLTEFSLPANSNIVVSNIQLELLLLNVVSQFMNVGIDLNLSNYQFDVEIEALGKTYTISGAGQ